MKGNQNNMLMLLSPSATQQFKELEEGGIPPTLRNGPLPVLSLRVIPEV
jgi:hypothetical protein